MRINASALTVFKRRMSTDVAGLQARIEELEAQVAALSARKIRQQPQLPGQRKNFDFSKYPRRKIALLFSYEGWPYSGLAIQRLETPLPTVEQKLLHALKKACLVPLDADVEEIGWARCGRTDRGVSSSGQVVSLWVRSGLAMEDLQGIGALAPGEDVPPAPRAPTEEEDGVALAEWARNVPPAPARAPANCSNQEIEYAFLLNRILPDTIRILAWSPVDPRFDARFSCRGRHYKYFFSSSAALPLDITAMQEAATALIGEHDFRNFCTFDPAKQISNYWRRVISAQISEIPSTAPLTKNEKHYVLDLHGTAFLYHQVRHIMGLLFLVGAGSESPSIIPTLLDVNQTPTKPIYEIANEIPLVLWSCDYSSGVLEWKRESNMSLKMTQRLEHLRIQHDIQRHHYIASQELPGEEEQPDPTKQKTQSGAGNVIRVTTGKYVPLLKRARGDHYETANEKWRQSAKGQRFLAKYFGQGANDPSQVNGDEDS